MLAFGGVDVEALGEDGDHQCPGVGTAPAQGLLKAVLCYAVYEVQAVQLTAGKRRVCEPGKVGLLSRVLLAEVRLQGL